MHEKLIVIVVLLLVGCALGVSEQNPPCEQGCLATVYQPAGEGRASDKPWTTGTLVRDGARYRLDDMLFPEHLVHLLDENAADDAGVSSRKEGLIAVPDSDMYWPDAIVPYVIDSGLPDQDRVHRAIEQWQSATALRFVPRTDQKDYVRFIRRAEGCLAYVGRVGGEQTVELGDTCRASAAVHEIGHAVGFWHEHGRTDRDDHIQILWHNIDEQHFPFFDERTTGKPIGAYDRESIMHYHSYAFSKNGKPTLLRRDGSEIFPDGFHLSRGDREGVASIYGAYRGLFSDDDESVHEKDIEKIANAGITQGCGDHDPPRFCPKDTVTRGQMATFLVRALDLPRTLRDYFDDDDGEWYEDPANRFREAKLTVGCEPRKFCGGREITRAEMAVFLTRALELPPESNDYFDDDDGEWYESSANRMAEAKITFGCDERRYCGDNLVTREQMASFLARSFL